MNLSLLRKYRQLSRFAFGHSLIHPECPIEQTVRGNDAETRSRLMLEPWSRKNRPDGTLFVASEGGLRLLGTSQGALDAAVKPLRLRFGARLVVDPPNVRYAFGAPTLEPYMSVLINGPQHHLAVIQKDFLGRRGRIMRLDHRGPFIFEGEAPLACLLGYREWLRHLMQDDPCVGLRLSRYLPIDDGGPRAA